MSKTYDLIYRLNEEDYSEIKGLALKNVLQNPNQDDRLSTTRAFAEAVLEWLGSQGYEITKLEN